MAKKPAHGGKWSAGRSLQPEGATVVLAASVPESLADALDKLAEAKGWNRSKAVTEAIRGLLKRKGALKRREGESNPTGIARPYGSV